MGCSFSFSSFRHVGVMGSFLVWERSRKGAEWQENYGATEGEKEGQGSPQPHLENDSSPRQPSPHLILGCPVVMFFNYVSLFNVAAAHPYLVNRCNFSCRVEMQPSHPGIKGQIELPRAHTHTHTHTHREAERERERERERDLHLFLYSFRLHLQFEPQQGDFQHAKQLSRKMWGMAIYPLYMRYFIFVCTVTPENIFRLLKIDRGKEKDSEICCNNYVWSVKWRLKRLAGN